MRELILTAESASRGEVLSGVVIAETVRIGGKRLFAKGRF